MEKINIAELLKDCPKSMELDCSIFEDVTLYKIDTDIENDFPIRIKTKNDYFLDLTKYGTYSNVEEAKCVIFPKGKTTWEGFVPPCKFKEGDVVISAFGDIHLLRTEDSSYCAYRHRNKNKLDTTITTNITVVRFATEEEKDKLFKAIEENGYRWNNETKTLEKLPKFKIGNRIRSTIVNSGNIYTVLKIEASKYIVKKNNETDNCNIYFDEENIFELVPNKFDINTLKPFDKVLVRDGNKDKWNIDFFAYCRDGDDYQCMTFVKNQCIPYEGNEHLLSNTDDCDDFYKTWEK